MTKTRRKFTPEEKHSILREAEQEGYTETCRKYNLAASVLAYWKKNYLAKGKDGLKGNYRRSDPAMKALIEENERLKKIVAKQLLELEFKTELIKKNQAHLHRGRR